MAAPAGDHGQALQAQAWNGFHLGVWQNQPNVRDFIQQNFRPYYGDESFLTGPTPRTQAIWNQLNDLFVEERRKGVLDVSQIPSSITAHNPGYIDRENEIVVGLQTDAPLKRAIMPNGGLRMVLTSLDAYGYTPDPAVVDIFTKYRKTHNEAVFDAYTADIRKCRSSHILTGLPDAYGRGRIIGDYRRVALYGVARLIEEKQRERRDLDFKMSTDDIIRDREELSEQTRALKELQDMALSYGFDISGPATTAREAVQWLYFAYLAAIKEQNGAAMSLGRVSTFLDIYFERDMANGTLTESQAQEIVDDFVMKLRIVRFLRTPEYDELFAGDPAWVTESIGGTADDGRPLVTKNSFRFLNTLYNLGPAPEPNLTVWYSPRLPEPFRRFAARVSIETSALQFESDEMMRGTWGDDAAIACCVSPMLLGKQMQLFGARANLAKCLLYAINGGRDEVSGQQVGPPIGAAEGEYLDFDIVSAKFESMMDWLAGVYVNAMNVIHYMHDKYAYERIEMALHDYAPLRTMAFGMAGLSVVADSLSAIRYAKVRVERDGTGLVTDYHIEGDFPKFGNNDNRVDQLAAWVVSTFMKKLRKYPTYRNALHTQSILTITSNVVYGKATGNTPDGRRRGEPFAPGANPMHGRDTRGLHAAAASVAKIPYRDAADGISLTTTFTPDGLGRVFEDRITNLTSILDTYFSSTGYHMNVNVLNREMLLDAIDHPEKYPHLTIRVSGYAVNFVRLTRQQQLDVISRTFHSGKPAEPKLIVQSPALEAQSPYELRVNQGSSVSEAEVREALATGDMGFLHSFTTGSPVDGPGVRVVAWTTGCMFRCQYCHNPDTWNMTNGIPVTIARATEELRKYRYGLKLLAGGLTLSGGEPLMQHRFAIKLFSAAKTLGIHTALDTNGYFGHRLTQEELEKIDLVLLDIKAWDPELHRRLTGMDIDPVLGFARHLAKLKRPVWVRFVLVPGVNDNISDVAGIASFAAWLGNVERVDVLPLHHLGSHKWAQLGLEYTLGDVQPPSAELVERVRLQFEAVGLKAY